jgi:ribonuclease T2
MAARGARAKLVAWAKFLLAVAVLGIFIGVADAQDRRKNTPGQFDYYVLASSWVTVIL